MEEYAGTDLEARCHGLAELLVAQPPSQHELDTRQSHFGACVRVCGCAGVRVDMSMGALPHRFVWWTSAVDSPFGMKLEGSTEKNLGAAAQSVLHN
jgi:hypothetical protein